MGYTCHVATKYEVRYGHGFFSQEQEFINSLLSEPCPGLWCDDDSADYSEELEVPKNELKAAIDEIKGSKEEYVQKLKDAGVKCSVEELIENLETWLNEADANNDFIRLSWF